MKQTALFLLFSFCLTGQINPDKIDIVRDAYGVPHIFSETDAELAYGLAWAHAEDDFKTIQQGYLAGNALLSLVEGKRELKQAAIMLRSPLARKMDAGSLRWSS